MGKNSIDVFKDIENADRENIEYWIQRCRDLEGKLQAFKSPKMPIKRVKKEGTTEATHVKHNFYK